MTLSSSESEFIGILLGDGHLDPKNYGITIVGGYSDAHYILVFIPNLIKKLYGNKIKIHLFNAKTNKCIFCKFYNKEIFDKIKKYIKPGRKNKLNTRIPKVILHNKLLLKHCLKGLIDTDGGIYPHHQKCAQIEFSSKIPSLQKDVKNQLKKLGFNPSISGKSIFMFNKDVLKYFNEIGSNNLKSIIKFKKWIKLKRVLRSKETILNQCISIKKIKDTPHEKTKFLTNLIMQSLNL